MKRLALAAGLFALAASPALAERMEVLPGQWENANTMSISMNMGGQPMTIPAQTHTSSQCVTPEEAVLDLSDITQEGCRVENLRETSSSVSFDMFCNNDGVTMTGNMEMAVSADRKSVSGQMTMQGEHPSMGTMSMSGEFSGRHTGDC